MKHRLKDHYANRNDALTRSQTFVKNVKALALLPLAAICTACGGADTSPIEETPVEETAGNVTASRVLAEANSGDNWLVKGGRFTNEYYSPLDSINTQNVSELGVAWVTDIPSPAGLVAEPLVVDGVAYMSAPRSVVHAVDVETGESLWVFDPEVDPSLSIGSSLSVRWNRGVAVWEGAVIVGTGDCRLVAIDAALGTKLWDVPACDPIYGGGGAGITGAPLVADDKVFIGYMGVGDYGRGSVAAFDVATGEQLWRFWSVPGDPADGFDSEMQRTASESWSGRAGTGGNVWHAIHYDHVTDFVIFGTAGPRPQSLAERGDLGDNLFTNSVIAVDASTGEYMWHYQTVPGDGWDYDAVMPKIVTDLSIDGKQRRVVFEASKNGFFYVLDALTGELLSADPIATVTWASHVDLETGRPVVLPDARYWEKDDSELPVVVYPSALGARNWEPMAYNADTGLVYMPVADVPSVFCSTSFYQACELPEPSGSGVEQQSLTFKGGLIAWDPVKREPRWSVDHPLPFNGGVLTTAGNLVFQGTGTGELQAYNAETGEHLWSGKTGSSIQAAPVSYRLGEEQFILVAVGAGGGTRFAVPEEATTAPDARGPSRLIAYKIGGEAQISANTSVASLVPSMLEPPVHAAAPGQIELGRKLYVSASCDLCHGTAAMAMTQSLYEGMVPDLRSSGYLYSETAWNDAVIGGVLAERGMLAMDKHKGLSDEDAEAIRAYVIDEAWKAYQEQAGEDQ